MHRAPLLTLCSPFLLLACGGGEDGTDSSTAATSSISSSAATQTTGIVQTTGATDPTDPTTAGTTDATDATTAVTSDPVTTDPTTSATETTETDPTSATETDPTSATETDATTDETTDATTDEPTTEAATPPEVVMVVPDDGALGVDPKPQLAVTFSEVMNLNSITANTVDDVCQGSVQLSADGFATCVQIAAKPDTDDSLTFTLTPAGFLESATDYQLRVTTFAEDLEGEALVADYESAGFTIRYFHTITIDGLDDFTGDELFATTTPMFTGRVAWDTAFLYLGFQGPDFADGAPDAGSKFLVVYLGGPMGTASGVTYNTQQPTLPFSARWHLRYKLDDSFTSVLTWSGNAWVETGWSLVGATDHADDFVELRLPLAMLGDPDAIDLHASVLNEKGFAEATFAGVPDSSFVDGYDPDYGAHFTFELKGSTLPADTLP